MQYTVNRTKWTVQNGGYTGLNQICVLYVLYVYILLSHTFVYHAQRLVLVLSFVILIILDFWK